MNESNRPNPFGEGADGGVDPTPTNIQSENSSVVRLTIDTDGENNTPTPSPEEFVGTVAAATPTPKALSNENNDIEYVPTQQLPSATLTNYNTLKPIELTDSTVQGKTGNGLGSVFASAAFALVALLALGLALWFFLRKKLTFPKKKIEVQEEVPPTRPVVIKGVSGISAGGCQFIGAREHQEDSFGVSDVNNSTLCEQKGVLAVVADGIGGLDDGQVASKLVVQSMATDFFGETNYPSAAIQLLSLAANAHMKVLELRRQQNVRCGSTLVAVLIHGSSLSFISIGDSRILLYRAGGFIQLNREHKLGNRMDERAALGDVESGTEVRKPAALTSHMGMEDLRLIDRNTEPIELLPGDRLLLMSDGVYGVLSDDELLRLLCEDAQQSAAAICDAVKAKGRRNQDNATVVVLNVR